MPMNNYNFLKQKYKKIIITRTLNLPVNQTHMVLWNRDMCFRYMELHTSEAICHASLDVNLCCIAELANS
jgi:hypothetical protein